MCVGQIETRKFAWKRNGKMNIQFSALINSHFRNVAKAQAAPARPFFVSVAFVSHSRETCGTAWRDCRGDGKLNDVGNECDFSRSGLIECFSVATANAIIPRSFPNLW